MANLLSFIADITTQISNFFKNMVSRDHSNPTLFNILRKNVRQIILLRVGVLSQYPPRPLFIPERYLTKGVAAKQMLPSISIVTPSLNQGEFIERTVRSILDQQYPKLEYIIQDGNSKDNTGKLLENFQEQLAHFESREDSGQAHAINLGFQKSSGEIMGFINSDDMLLPGTLKYIAVYFTEHPDVDVVYGHRVIINEEDQEIGRWVLPPHDNKMLQWSDFIPQETLFWRRTLWEKVGGFVDETFQFALDWELLLRFQSAHAKFKRLPRFLAAFRVHNKQKTSLHMDSVGLEEMKHLWLRTHGREIDAKEVRRNSIGYVMQSLIFHLCYELGIIRY